MPDELGGGAGPLGPGWGGQEGGGRWRVEGSLVHKGPMSEVVSRAVECLEMEEQSGKFWTVGIACGQKGHGCRFEGSTQLAEWA